MAKRGPALLAAAGGVALAALVLAACQNYGQPKSVADASEAIPDRPDYNWDVRPILSQNCFQCHGNDGKNRKAGLRLDVADAAYGKLPEDPGKRAIVPGNPRRSELFKRITSTDPDYRMPPRDAHKTVSARDIAILERWIKQGARYKNHWAYLPVKEIKPKRSEWDKQAVNQIDRYIYATLEKKGLAPSPEADRETLINRVTMDLTGLPPTLAEVDAFVADKSPDAYEKLVDRLLNSTAYAERQANIWLDVARYADTGGGLNDNEQSIAFPYRDWVISAFKRNIPYDKFVTWQLAGDKLPNATKEQILATAFIRAGKKNNEGGAIDEDFRLEYVLERTELVGKAFLGLTVGCAKCHDHKYDVISQADYYSLSGFFNQIDERGIHGGSRGTPMGPTLEWPTPMQAKAVAAARGTVAARWAAYQQALSEAKARAAAGVDRIPAVQRASFVKGAIDADTQAYYPLDSGYKGPLDSLIEDEQPRAPAQPPDGQADTPPGKTRAQVQAEVKVRILEARRQYEALKAAGKPIPETIEKVVNPQPAGRRALAAGALQGADKGKPGAKPIKASLKRETVSGRGADGKVAVGGKGSVTPVAVVAPRIDPDLPRVASREVDRALDQLVASGYRDARTGLNSRINKRQLRPGLRADAFYWTPSGIPGGKPGGLSNIKWVPGAKGQGVQLKDSVVFADPSVGKFERFQPYTLDLWIKLRAKAYEDVTRPQGPDASILFTSGGVEGQGYDLQLNDGKLEYTISHSAPFDQIKIGMTKPLPRGSWQHVTVTYDGNSKAAGLKLYVNGQLAQTQVFEDRLTRTAMPRGQSSLNFGYYGLQAGANFNRPELVDGALDELRVLTRALTPAEVAYLHNPQAFARLPEGEVRAGMIEAAASKDPAVVAAWQALTEARAAEQRAETPVYRLMVAADTTIPRPTHILDRGVYNSYKGDVSAQALPRVFKWDAKLPKNRLGLTQWLFDPKNPLTARVYVNRMWQSHFGTGIVQTVEDFGTQGSNPTHPELLDYLATEFIRSGWDQRHMHKLMVMSATYRQSSAITKDKLEKDPRNFLLARGPRYRLSAEQLRDSALFTAGLLVDKPGGDSVFPYQPEGIWDGAAQGFVTYPFDTPNDQMHRRSMYSFVKRNAPAPNMVVFDQPDRNLSSVSRTLSNTPLQSLVLLNDPQYLEAYRKLAERAIKTGAGPDQQLLTIFRLAARRHPNDREMASLRRYRDAVTADLSGSPGDVDKLLSIGVAKADPKVDRVRLAALTMLTAGVMNSPDAYTLR
jgi:hypothetical protein